MLTMAKLAVLGVVAAGILSLVFGFSFNSGFHRNPPPANVIHTKVIVERPPTAHWPKGRHTMRPVHPNYPKPQPHCQTTTTTTTSPKGTTHTTKRVCK